MFGFLLGFFYGCLFEHVIHRFVFHGLGKKRSSIFAFHLREHHVNAKRNNFRDHRFSLNEMIGVPVLMLVHLPLYWAFPTFYISLCTYAVAFVIIHNLSHKHPAITKKYLWWHWNHHMKNQNKSWGVVCPVADILMGTLEEKQDSGDK